MRKLTITSRQSAIAVMSLLAVISILTTVVIFVSDLPVEAAYLPAFAFVATLTNIGLLAAYLRGFEAARYGVVLFITIATTLGTPVEQHAVDVALYVPLALSLLLLTPPWIMLVTLATAIGLAWRAGLGSAYTQPTFYVLFMFVVGVLILARLSADTAQRTAEENARRAEDERARAEARAAELDAATHRLEEELERQRSLLALVETLETPVARLADGVLFAPVVGHLDTRRAEALMKRLLEAVHEQRAVTMIIDIAGVPLVDTGVAASLVRMVRGLRMLGCEVIVSGISAPVATALVQLGASLGDIRTVRSPQEALQAFSLRN